MSKFKIFILFVFILSYAAFGETYRKADVTNLKKIENGNQYEFYGYRRLPDRVDLDKSAIVDLNFEKEPFIYAYIGATGIFQDPPQPAAKIALIKGDDCESDSVGIQDIESTYITCGDRVPPDDLKRRVWVAHNPANGQMCRGRRGAAEIYNIVYRCGRVLPPPPGDGGDKPPGDNPPGDKPPGKPPGGGRPPSP